MASPVPSAPVSLEPVLQVRDVKVTFGHGAGKVHALDGVSLEIHRGEIVAVVGESGCGKTTLARSVLGLQRLSGGEIDLAGERVAGVRKGAARTVGMVWQDPYASLNPRWRVGRSALEPAALNGERKDPIELFERVGLRPDFVSRFPHEMSGGQRQRVAIARALALDPPLVICDEPTSALDLSIRAQILNLLKDVRDRTGSAFLYISHDLATVRFLADRVAVMYAGKIVEHGTTADVFERPQHPYTQTLLDSAPTLDHLLSTSSPSSNARLGASDVLHSPGAPGFTSQSDRATSAPDPLPPDLGN